MLEKKQIFAYDDPPKTFRGVRFVLLGFDSVKEDQVRLKLLQGGATEAVNYGPDCTHVIVDNIVSDDTVCLAARRDGKVLVTGLWVDHSFDVAVPLNPASVMYKPRRDLNGIPGAKSLVICLTGYLRNDREDIMTMVSLMGAQFSKPLVPTKVTHLICFKFEGEKYALAKRTNKIKLINHRWLEDCLKAWELLPEDEYTKSGYELGIEAEAKDSEDEREALPQVTDLERKIVVSPQNTHLVNRSPYLLPVNNEFSRNNSSLSGSRTPADADGTSKMHSTPREEFGFEKMSFPWATHEQNLQMPSFYISRSPGKLSAQLPSVKHDRISEKAENILASTSESALKSSDKNVSKLGSKSTFRSSPILPLSSEMESPSPSKVNKHCVVGGIPPLERLLDGTGPYGVKTPSNETQLYHSDGKTSILPNKRKLSISGGSTKSSTLSHSLVTSVERGMPEKMTEAQTSRSSIDGSRGSTDNSSPAMVDCHLREEASPHVKEALGISVSLEERRKNNDGALQETGEGLIKKNLSRSDLMDLSSGQTDNSTAEVGMHQIYLRSVEPPVDELDSGLGKLKARNTSIVENSEIHLKLRKRKMLVKKTLGSRPVVGKGNTTKNKRCLDLQKAVRPNEPASHSNELATEDFANANVVEKVSVIPPANVEDAGKQIGLDAESYKENSDEVDVPHPGMGVQAKKLSDDKILHMEEILSKSIGRKTAEAEKSGRSNKMNLIKSDSTGDAGEKKLRKGKKRSLSKSQTNTLKNRSEDVKRVVDQRKQEGEKIIPDNDGTLVLDCETERTQKKLKGSGDAGKENKPTKICPKIVNTDNGGAARKLLSEPAKKSPSNVFKPKKPSPESLRGMYELEVKSQPAYFILSGHRLQRKEFQNVIKKLQGKVCRDSHHWSYHATHFIVPDPVRRTEKFFAAAASGSWILKTDYLTASNEAGRFLSEEPYEWNTKCLTEDGSINLEAPRKWRLLRERTGRGAFYGMRIVIYGECIAPPLETLKRVVKAGDGTILATSPPYTRFFETGIDFAIVCPGMPRVDMWIQEFLRHEVPCVLADYLVEYVCKPGYPLEKHVQYNTHSWAQKSLATHIERIEDVTTPDGPAPVDDIDISCQVCGRRDGGDEMLICGDESGSHGCGVGMHIYCLRPPLDQVPEEDWFCQDCMSGSACKGAALNL